MFIGFGGVIWWKRNKRYSCCVDMNSKICVDGIRSLLNRHCFPDLSSLPVLLICQDNGFGYIIIFIIITAKPLIFKVVANKDFGHSRKWILTYQICNAVVLDHLFQFWSGCDVWPRPYFRKYTTDIGFFSFSWKWTVGGGGWALTASCEQEWRLVVSVILWDFSMLEVGVVGCFVGIGWN